jgi:Na+/melibiose symporter-like transporter
VDVRPKEECRYDQDAQSEFSDGKGSPLTMDSSDLQTTPVTSQLKNASDDCSSGLTTSQVISYAAPVAGSYFFYISMWSVVPGIYGKYFGLKLTSIATVLLVIRLFDGIIDTTTGYLSDLHRSAGGSRKPWVVVGGLGSVIVCYFLYVPPTPATTSYYLLWSMAYFLFFTITEIPHLTWGSELTMDYQKRSNVFGIRNMVGRFSITIFFCSSTAAIQHVNQLYASNPADRNLRGRFLHPGWSDPSARRRPAWESDP